MILLIVIFFALLGIGAVPYGLYKARYCQSSIDTNMNWVMGGIVCIIISMIVTRAM